MITLEFHFQHTSEVLISSSLLICGNLRQEITWHWLCCHQLLHVPFTQHAATSWWMCKYGCNEVHRDDCNCCTVMSTFWNPVCAKFIYTFCIHIKLLMWALYVLYCTSEHHRLAWNVRCSQFKWTQQNTTIKSCYIFWQQEDLLHFKDMLHNSFYFLQNDIYFTILSVLFKWYVFIKYTLTFKYPPQ